MLHRRITLADEEFAQWRAGVPPDPTSSVGLRLEFLQNTLEIIRGSPVLGVGTGGFGKAYADRFDGTGAPVTQNPHNEILLMMVQFGIAGFVLLAGLFVTQWRLAPRLESRSETAAARALVLTFAITSLLSSTLLDHAEGFFFVYMSGAALRGVSRPGAGSPGAADPVSPVVPDARAPTVPAPASVLVVVTRRLGDVLLATPLLRSIKAAWPQAAVDALVFAGTRDVVASHPDVRRVLTVAERPGMIEHAAFIFRLLRRYDLALSCVAGDRPTLYAALAGRHSVGLVMPGNRCAGSDGSCRKRSSSTIFAPTRSR